MKVFRWQPCSGETSDVPLPHVQVQLGKEKVDKNIYKANDRSDVPSSFINKRNTSTKKRMIYFRVIIFMSPCSETSLLLIHIYCFLYHLFVVSPGHLCFTPFYLMIMTFHSKQHCRDTMY